MAPHLPAGLREGDIVATRYRIEDFLGAGAMGTVVAAHHLLLAQRVAIKFLHPRSVENAEARARFIHEARAANRIRNDHVVRVIDVSTLENDDLYIVMEYLEGCDFAKWLRRRGPLPVDEAVDYVLQACEGLAEAHELGIVHRDLKPENLFAVQRAGVVETIKILDFGISKTAEWLTSTLEPGDATQVTTGESTLMGSAPYMSPEQMESPRDVDHRSDIWALGIVLCELVTGRRPFDGRTPIEVYHQIMSRSLPRLAGPGVLPAGLESVIRTCMSRSRDRRYASVRDFAVALQSFGSSEAIGSVERISRAKPALTRASYPPPRGPGQDLARSRGLDTPKTLASFGQAPPSVERPAPRTGGWRHAAAAALVFVVAMAGVIAAKHGHVHAPPTGSSVLAAGPAEGTVPSASALTEPRIEAATLLPGAPADAPLTVKTPVPSRGIPGAPVEPANARRAPRPAPPASQSIESPSRSGVPMAPAPSVAADRSPDVARVPAPSVETLAQPRPSADPDAEDRALLDALRSRK